VQKDTERSTWWSGDRDKSRRMNQWISTCNYRKGLQRRNTIKSYMSGRFSQSNRDSMMLSESKGVVSDTIED